MFQRVELVHYQARGHVGTPLPIGGNHSKIEFQGVRQRRDTFGATGIFGHDHGLFPVGNIVTDPAGDQWFRVKVINRALEESLHLRGVQVDSYYVFDPGHVEQSSQQPGSDGPAM